MLELEIKFNSNENKETYKQEITDTALFYGLILNKETDNSVFYKMELDSKFSTYYTFAKAVKFFADFKWFDEKVVEVVIKR